MTYRFPMKTQSNTIQKSCLMLLFVTIPPKIK